MFLHNVSVYMYVSVIMGFSLHLLMLFLCFFFLLKYIFVVVHRRDFCMENANCMQTCKSDGISIYVTRINKLPTTVSYMVKKIKILLIESKREREKKCWSLYIQSNVSYIPPSYSFNYSLFDLF